MRTGTETRRRRLRGLIAEREISNQRQIVNLLADEGFTVTQATVSRDLDAIGATRTRRQGTPRYELADPGRRDERMTALHDAMTEFTLSITASANLLVLKVPPGAAQFVASRIDAAPVDGVLGSIAGDDTILVVTAEGHDPAAIIQRLEGTS